MRHRRVIPCPLRCRFGQQGGRHERAWRWPFAGFVVGALWGRRSSLQRRRASSSRTSACRGRAPSARSRTHPCSSRARESRSSCGTTWSAAFEGEPRAACSPKGSVFIRPRALRRSSSIRSPATTAGCSPPRCPRTSEPLASTTTPSSRTAVASLRAFPRERHGTASRLAASELTTVALDEPFRGTRLLIRWPPGLRGQGRACLGLDSGREQSRIGPSASTSRPTAPSSSSTRSTAARRHARRQAKRAPDRVRRREGDRRRQRRDDLRARRGWSGAQRRRILRSRRPDRRDAAGRAERRHGAGGPGGAIVHAYLSEMWLPTGAGAAAADSGRAVPPGALPARSFGDGIAVVVSASSDEARLPRSRPRPAHVAPEKLDEPRRGATRRALWRRSARGRPALEREAGGVPRRPTSRDGFRPRASVDRAGWAESRRSAASGSHGDTLYQLRSTHRAEIWSPRDRGNSMTMRHHLSLPPRARRPTHWLCSRSERRPAPTTPGSSTTATPG